MKAEGTFEVIPGVQGRRWIVLDERGVGLRATWHPQRGFINLSLWKDDRCVETFHLTPNAASVLMAFVVRALASSVPAPTPTPLKLVTEEVSTADRGPDLVSRLRDRLADDLTSFARRIRP